MCLLLAEKRPWIEWASAAGQADRIPTTKSGGPDQLLKGRKQDINARARARCGRSRYRAELEFEEWFRVHASLGGLDLEVIVADFRFGTMSSRFHLPQRHVVRCWLVALLLNSVHPAKVPQSNRLKFDRKRTFPAAWWRNAEVPHCSARIRGSFRFRSRSRGPGAGSGPVDGAAGYA